MIGSYLSIGSSPFDWELPVDCYDLISMVWCAQFSFALMHVSAHRALEYIPPLAFGSLRICIAIPFLLLSCRIQVTPCCPSQPTMTRTCTHEYMHAHKRSRTQTCVHAYKHAQAYACMHTHVHTCTYSQTSVCIYIRTHMCMHACTHAHRHTNQTTDDNNCS